MSAYDDNDLGALNRLEDLLEAYCEVRLAPQGATLARIRASVLAEAAAVSAANAAANRPRLLEPAPKTFRWSLPPRFTRTALAFGFAATLTVGTTFSVLASPPGSPFYNARVFIETMSLPAQAAARLVGHEKLLDERIAEARAAAASGDTVGLDAALAAYRSEVDSASADAGTNPDQLAHLEEMLAKHTAVLAALETRLPDASSIDKAIDASSKAITRLQEKTHAARPTHPAQGGGGAGGQGGSQGGRENGGQGQNEDRD